MRTENKHSTTSFFCDPDRIFQLIFGELFHISNTSRYSCTEVDVWCVWRPQFFPLAKRQTMATSVPVRQSPSCRNMGYYVGGFPYKNVYQRKGPFDIEEKPGLFLPWKYKTISSYYYYRLRELIEVFL